jgi:hypothetical protein
VKEERNVKSVLNTNESIEKHTERNKEQYENHKEEKFRAYPLDVTILIKDSGIWAPNSFKGSARGPWILISDLLRVDTSAADKKSSKP